MALPASEQAKRIKETMAQTHGIGLSESQRNSGQGAAVAGKMWNERISDWRGAKKIPAMLFARTEHTSENEKFNWVQEVVVPMPAYGSRPLKAVGDCFMIRSFQAPEPKGGKTPKGVRLCRPSERVLDLLPPQRGQFIKEDGEVVILAPR